MDDNKENITDKEKWQEWEKTRKEEIAALKAQKKSEKKAEKEARKMAAEEVKAKQKADKEAEKKAAEEIKAKQKADKEAEKKSEKAVIKDKDTGKETKPLKSKAPKSGASTGGPTVRVQKIKKNRIKGKLIFFIILAAALLFISVFARLFCPYDPYEQDLMMAKQAPSMAHPLGTDSFGRDMLSRVIMGSQASIYSTLLLVGIVSVIGTLFGVFCGWKGGKIDSVLMRISDVFLAFPELVFALAVAGVLGGGIQNAILAMAAVAWPKYARIARSQTLAQKETPYMYAARLSGDTTFKMIFKHIMPNILGPVLVTAMLDIGTMMMGLSGLSYLGLGAQPPTAEWGSMMSDSRSMLQTYPWITLSPGVAIFISVMIFNLLGDTVRDYLDPKQRTK